MLEALARAAEEFDLVHSHVDYLAYPWLRRIGTPALTILHGRLDLPELHAAYDEYDDMPVVSISAAQRAPLPQAAWVGRVHHGLPPDLYRFRERPGTYLAYCGRMSPEKRVDDAIRIACRTGIPLRIAAKVDAKDRPYFEEVVRPLLSDRRVELVGEIGDHEKQDFLGDALALLFPIDWPEPFGLAVIEALACGTPVVARRRGAIPEIVDDGVTGFVVEDCHQAVAAVESLDGISRRECRRVFEERFTAARMVADYVALYEARIGSTDQPVAADGGSA